MRVFYHNHDLTTLPCNDELCKALTDLNVFEMVTPEDARENPVPIAILHDRDSRVRLFTVSKPLQSVICDGIALCLSSDGLDYTPRLVNNEGNVHRHWVVGIVRRYNRDADVPFVTVDEWKELLTWASKFVNADNEEKQRLVSEPSLPTVCRQPVVDEALMRLYVVCECFLALAWANGDNGEQKRAAEALKIKPDSEAEDAMNAHFEACDPNRLIEQWQAAQTAQWWRNYLNDYSGLKCVISGEWDRVTAPEGAELDGVTTLVNKITTDPPIPIEIDTVAAAREAMYRLLKARAEP